MKSVLNPEILEVMTAVQYRPAVSVIIPFDPKMGLKAELSVYLKQTLDKVDRELQQDYPNETGQLVMQKLRSLVKNLNFNTLKKSIAIYVSPVFEKVLYLDIPVEEKIIVDGSFEIRDLVYSKKQLHKYLLMLLSSKECRIYLGNSKDFVRIVSNYPGSAEAYQNELPEKVANFSDPSARKEIMMDKFLQHMDHSLDIILRSYRLPLFVMGTDRVIGHFKKITKHEKSVVGFIPGNYEEKTPEELRSVLAPYISDWNKVMQQDIINQLEAAADKKKLVTGMKNVWKEAVNNRGRLLIVEKNYMYAAEQGGEKDIIYKTTETGSHHSYIKDAVDDAIEKVLEGGGDVEFVEPGVLTQYEHIALVLYY